MADRLVHEQQLARLLGRAAELQEQAGRREEACAAGEDAQLAGSHRLTDIKAAAAEAGIDEQFVTLAALELAAAGPTETTALTPVQRRRAARWLGAREPGLAQVARVHAPFERLMAAIGSTVQMPQYGLRLADSNPDLTRGGTMLLKMPQSVIGASGVVLQFVYYLRGALEVDSLRLTIEPRGEQEHELGVAVGLEQAWTPTYAWSLRLAVVFGGFGAWIMWASAGSLAAPLAVALPLTAAAAALAAWFGTLVMRWTYAHYVSKARLELRKLLDDIDGAVRSQVVFGVLPPNPPIAAHQSDDAIVALSTLSVDV